jgi:hypothetical protein
MVRSKPIATLEERWAERDWVCLGVELKEVD